MLSDQSCNEFKIALLVIHGQQTYSIYCTLMIVNGTYLNQTIYLELRLRFRIHSSSPTTIFVHYH